MNYYIVTHYWDYATLRNSIVKGRDDIFEQWNRIGLSPIEIGWIDDGRREGLLRRIRKQFEILGTWKKSLSPVRSGDVLVFHNPPSKRFMFYPKVMKEQKRKGAKIILQIFDMDSVIRLWPRMLRPLMIVINEYVERSIYKSADVIIAHNETMKKQLLSMGVSEDKIILHYAFDYLEPNPMKEVRRDKDGAAIFTGNLEVNKAGFVYDLPDNFRFNLYGPGYEECNQKDNVEFKGVYKASELFDYIEGSYGLVWGGSTSDICSGNWGRALKYENPHKASMYLAAGLPLIVYREAGIGDFVRETGCGIFIDSLYDINEVVKNLTQEEYDVMQENAVRIGNMLRSGEMSDKVFREALRMAGAEV